MRRLAVVLLVVALGACTHRAADATPEGAVREWIDKMEAAADEPEAAKAAYQLLGPKAKKNLGERAERASRIQGRHVEGEDMLATGRFGLRFRPQTMKATITGDDAQVDVYGADPSQHALVSCHREGDHWRVEPSLPDQAELPHRPDGGT
ncbi:hypothetical protein BH09MYX1_BH09MYX1_39240 [soil metagenome]